MHESLVDDARRLWGEMQQGIVVITSRASARTCSSRCRGGRSTRFPGSGFAWSCTRLRGGWILSV